MDRFDGRLQLRLTEWPLFPDTIARTDQTQELVAQNDSEPKRTERLDNNAFHAVVVSFAQEETDVKSHSVVENYGFM